MGWSLIVDGEVERPLELSLERLQEMATGEVDAAIECRSGEASSGRWSGVSLAALLGAAGARDGATTLVASGRDGHSHHVRMEEDSLRAGVVALELDGRPLTEEGGYPLRLVVPGPGGKRAVKWLTRLTLARGED